MTHYTYLIQHKTKNKRYIGVRSCITTAQEDTLYWGSSRYLPLDVTQTHVKIILKIFETRQEAVEHEILLHKLNNVVKINHIIIVQHRHLHFMIPLVQHLP